MNGDLIFNKSEGSTYVSTPPVINENWELGCAVYLIPAI